MATRFNYETGQYEDDESIRPSFTGYPAMRPEFSRPPAPKPDEPPPQASQPAPTANVVIPYSSPVGPGGASPAGSDRPDVIGQRSRTVVSGEEKAATDEAIGLAKSQAELEEKAGEKAAELASAKGDAAAARATVRTDTDKSLDEREQAYQSEYTRRAKQIADEEDAIAKQPLKTLWQKATRGDRTKMIITVALAGIGKALRGGDGPNSALSIIENEVDRDLGLQRDERDQRRQRNQARKDALGEFEKQHDRSRSVLLARKASMLEKVGDEFEVRAATIGSEEARLRGQAAKTAAYEKANAIRLEAAKALREEVRTDIIARPKPVPGAGAAGPGAMAGLPLGGLGGNEYEPGKAPNVAQARADDFATRLTNDYAVVRQLPPMTPADAKKVRDWFNEQEALQRREGVNWLGFATGAIKSIEERLSPAGRAQFQALTRFTRNKLRPESGAAIGVYEFRDDFNSLARQVGDGDGEMGQKDRYARDVILGTAGQTHRPRYHMARLSQIDEARARASGGGDAAPAAEQPKTPDNVSGGPRKLTKEDKQAVAWAISQLRKNPKDPDAIEILRANGVHR